MANVIWTKEEYNDEVNKLYKEMKQYSYTKTDCVREVKKVMKENNITIKNKK